MLPEIIAARTEKDLSAVVIIEAGAKIKAKLTKTLPIPSKNDWAKNSFFF